jgi:tetratricopeptide (TPR) repeat protein
VGRREEAMNCWRMAYELGLRHTALLYGMGHAHYLNGDPEEACKYLREDAALHKSASAESLSLLCRVLKEHGDVTERLVLLPLLRETANRAAVISEMVEAMRDGGQLEEALSLLETSFFQNWEGGETAGLLWSSVVGALAERRAHEGRPDDARDLAGRMFVYPEGLFYGRSPRQSQARNWHALGCVYRLTGDLDKSHEAFRQGALEGGNPATRSNPEAMRWVRLCQDELRV